MTTGSTERSRAKADRQSALLREAARLFADRGFAGVSLEDLGTAVGITGPAVYRHFASKQALLGAILLDASRTLMLGGSAVEQAGGDADTQIDALIAFHVDFALAASDVIRVQDREMSSLSEDDRREVRRLQRQYVEIWVGVLQRLSPDIPIAELRLRAHACFGLVNSTPHSVRALRGAPGDTVVRATLRAMARAALTA